VTYLAKPLSFSLAGSGVLSILLAVIAYRTGEKMFLQSGGSYHTHVDATWVLAVLGVLLIVNAAVLYIAADAHDYKSNPDRLA
jgi:hypothetical protein